MKSNQNSSDFVSVRKSPMMDAVDGWFVSIAVSMLGAGGFGGFLGMKKEGIVATDARMLTQSTELGMSLGSVAQKGDISCPRAAPNGFASDATAVAVVLPCGLNHKSEYVVGAASTNG